MISFLVYGLTFACTLCGANLSNKNFKNKGSKIFGALMIFVPLLLVAGLRANTVGTDTQLVYYEYFYQRFGASNDSIFATSEFCFALLAKISYHLTHSYNGFLTIVGAFIAFFSTIGILKSSQDEKTIYSALVFLTFVFFDSLNLVRQMCAVSMIFAALDLLKKDRPIHFLVVLVISCFFHNSALICALIFVFYLLSKKKNSTLKALLLVILGLLPFVLPFVFDILSNISYFEKYVKLYSNLNFDISISNIALFIYNLPIYILVLVNYKKILKEDKFSYTLLLMCYMSAVCTLFKFSMVWLTRLTLYFSISYAYLIPKCIKYSKDKNLLSVVVILYCIVYFIFYYCIRGNSNIYPYHFFFEG